MTKSHALAALASLALAVGGVGCSSQTEGDRAMEKAARMESAANTIKRGEQMVQDGRAEEARGTAKRDQGDTLGGQGLIDAGKEKQAQGRALIEQGKARQTS